MKKILNSEEFLNERFFKPNYTKEKIKELIAKAKPLISKDKMDNFIADNKEQIEEVSDLITDENGEIDYGKVKDFLKSNLKP
jgi:dephospho-CoA kinase